MAINTFWNPTDKSSTLTLSNNNLTSESSGSSTSYGGVRANKGAISGKLYWEIKVDTLSSGVVMAIGIAYSTLPTDGIYAYGVNNGNSLVWQSNSASGGFGNAWQSTSIGSFTTNDVLGIALDLDSNKIDFYKSGIKCTVSYTFTRNSSTMVYPYLGKNADSVNKVKATANFGASSMTYPIPTGYSTFDKITKTKFLLRDEGNIENATMGNNVLRTNVVGSYPPTEDIFLNNGMDDISALYQRGDMYINENISGGETLGSGVVHKYHVKKSDMLTITSFETKDI